MNKEEELHEDFMKARLDILEIVETKMKDRGEIALRWISIDTY